MSDREEVIPIQLESDDDNEAIVATVIDDEVETTDEEENQEDDEDIGAPSEQEDTDAEIIADNSTTPSKVIMIKREKDKLINTRKDGIKTHDDASASAACDTPGTTASKGRKRKLSLKKPKSDEIPSIKNLGIPFRAVKRIMKVDKDIGTVQNEAAMVATYAAELFIEKLVKESDSKAKKKGRNTVKYEDLGEVRASHSNLSFLDTLIP
jgi:histone H3/H4